MLKFNEELIELLKTDPVFVSSDGRLLKNVVTERALALNPELIRLLRSKAKIAERFFKKIGDVVVFDRDNFVRFLNLKDFLPDSYTAFEQKIGLAAPSGGLLSKDESVVLNWPYKDCVLEGDMKKEDEKRNEVFYNEILAPDEIDRLLEPKVLAGFKKFDKNGEHPVTGFTRGKDGIIKDNLIIRGNNLLALHSLEKEFAGKVKLIYIDPPYNRDAEAFYNDSFHRSSWLVFMKNRLEIARSLLKPEGLIFIQIDDAQQAYLKVLCDEVFKEGFVNCIVVKSSETSGPKMAHVEKRLPKLKDYILVYRRGPSATLAPIEIEKDFVEKDKDYLNYYSKIIVNPGDPVGKWKIQSITDYCKSNSVDISDDEKLARFKLENAERVIYRTNNRSFEGLSFKTVTAEVTSSTGLQYIWWEGKQMLFLKDYLREHLADLWTDISTINLNKEGGVRFPAGKKPEELLLRILRLAAGERDIVLDYHLGSGSTAAVAHKIGLQYIGVEQLDYGENDAIVRLKNVITGDKSGVSEVVGWKSGGEFIYCELKENNEAVSRRIRSAETKDKLAKIWAEMKKTGFLSYRIDPKTFDEHAADFAARSLADQKRFLDACLEKNHLYVNLSEIDDSTYGLTGEEKKLNKAFYGL